MGGGGSDAAKQRVAAACSSRTRQQQSIYCFKDDACLSSEHKAARSLTSRVGVSVPLLYTPRLAPKSSYDHLKLSSQKNVLLCTHFFSVNAGDHRI